MKSDAAQSIPPIEVSACYDRDGDGWSFPRLQRDGLCHPSFSRIDHGRVMAPLELIRERGGQQADESAQDATAPQVVLRNLA